MRPITDMRPGEILAARDRTGILFVPVSPAFEWHSYHLPLGADAIIAEAIAREAAEAVDGLYFPVMSFGMDAWRTPEQKARWGLPPDAEVKGVNFPALPLMSEYCDGPEMIAAMRLRLVTARRNGFRYVFIVNNHGGQGQAKSLDALARELNAPDFRVCYLQVQYLVTDERLGCGGHANLDNETAMLAAFRPDLVDLAALPEGEMAVAEVGILHSAPIIPDERNPRHTSFLGVNERRHHLIARITDTVRAVVNGHPMTGNAGDDPY